MLLLSGKRSRILCRKIDFVRAHNKKNKQENGGLFCGNYLYDSFDNDFAIGSRKICGKIICRKV